MTQVQLRPWLPRFTRRHNIGIAVGLGMCLLASPWVNQIPLGLQVIVLAVAVAAAGLPHGALDLSLLRGAGLRSQTLFISGICYLVLTALVIVLFLVLPVSALVGFLVISLFHFGLGDTENCNGVSRGIEAIARGSVIVIAPVYFHTAEVAEIFSNIVGGDCWAMILHIISIIPPLLAPCFAAVFVAALLHRLYRIITVKNRIEQANSISVMLEMILTLLLFVFWPPLMAFLIYFCFIHSVRHLAEIGSSRHPEDPKKAAMWLINESSPLTVGTLLLAAGAWMIFAPVFEQNTLYLKIIFQGLAALTVPHMAISIWLHTQGDPKPGDLFYL